MHDYIKIYAKEMGKKIHNISKFDKSLFVRYKKDRNLLIWYNCKEDNIIKEVNIVENKSSLLLTALETQLPVVETEIELSYIYNSKYDNPCSYDVKNMVILPVVVPDGQETFGAFVLFDMQNSRVDFHKDKLDNIYELISKETQKDKKLKELLKDEYITGNSKNLKETELERANRFFASVVHDIRTPMNAVMGFLELLEQDATKEQKDYIKAAHTSSEMIVALVNDVLDFSKISMGKMDISMYYFSPLEEFKNSALLFHHSALKKKIKLIVYFDPHIPKFIKTDPHRLKQIINNLLSNAIKFTPEGGEVTLEFIYNKLDDSLSIIVADTGIGMSEEEQKSIFQPYKQATKSTAQNYGGTGLGLTISKQLSALLGGELRLESKPNIGSKFTFTIPCHSILGTPPSIEVNKDMLTKSVTIIEGKKSTPKWIEFIARYFKKLNIPHTILHTDEVMRSLEESRSDIYIAIGVDYIKSDFKYIVDMVGKSLVVLSMTPLVDIPYISEDTKVLNPPIFLSELIDAVYNIDSNEAKDNKSDISECVHKTVLVVDDNPINLKFMQEIAKRLGHTCLTALDGKEAIEMFEIHDIDIALIDKNMPIMNGIKAIKEIRKKDSLKSKDIKLYGLTGDSDKETINQMTKAGANAIFTKPISSTKLKEILCK